MVNVNANITCYPPEVGQKIYASFQWYELSFDLQFLSYGVCDLYNPDGDVVELELLFSSTGTTTISHTADKAGVWRAYIRGYNGSYYIEHEATVEVKEEEPPPPPPPPPPPEEIEIELSADPMEIMSGEWTTISWDVKNADHVFLDGIEVDHEGSKTAWLTDTHTFWIDAYNDDYEASDSVTVLVLPFEPPPTTYDLTVETTPDHCTIELYDENMVFINSSTSGSGGVATWSDLEPGTYSVKASKDGYISQTQTTTLDQDRTLTFVLEDEGLWGWIINFVVGGLEAMLGLQQGSLLTMLGNIWDIITNFGGAIWDFFSDVFGSIYDVISDAIGDFIGWVSDSFLDFVDWLGEIGGSIADYIGGAIDGAISFLTDKVSAFFDWLGEITGSVADYIGDAIGGFVDWSAEQLGGIWEGISTWVVGLIEGFVEAFFGGLNTGIEQARGSPLHSDEELKNPILKGLRKVVREHRKKHNRDEITGEKKHGPI